MAYTGNPSTVPADAVRLLIGDVGQVPILDDNSVTYFLTLAGNNVLKAAQYAAQAILFAFSSLVDERIDVLEVQNSQAARNYYEALKLFLTNPSLNVQALSAQPYAGGISKADIKANIQNLDNKIVELDRSLATEGNLFYSNPLADPSPFGPYGKPRLPFSVF